VICKIFDIFSELKPFDLSFVSTEYNMLHRIQWRDLPLTIPHLYGISEFLFIFLIHRGFSEVKVFN